MQSNSPYRIETYSGVKRDLKKLDKRVQEQILEKHYSNIEADPYQAYPLSHEFAVFGPIMSATMEASTGLSMKSILKMGSSWS